MRYHVLPAAMLATTVFAAAPVHDWEHRWAVSGKPELRVEVDDGRVTVTGGASRQIEARVTVTGWEIGPSGVQVTERQTGDRVELMVRVPRMGQWFSMGNRSVRVELRVPASLAAEIRTGDGAILTEGVGGSLRLKTGDGRIEALRVDGSLDADTGDGGIRVEGRLDGMKLHTGDGSIEAELSSGSKMTSAWDVSTGDGRVTLRLPEDFSANVNVRSGDGRIDVEMPLVTQGMKSEHEIRGKLNGGGFPLTVHTGDGSIRLARR